MATRSESLMFEQNAETTLQLTAPPRPPLAPPSGAMGGIRTIFWNERELRAGWRLLVYLLFFGIFRHG